LPIPVHPLLFACSCSSLLLLLLPCLCSFTRSFVPTPTTRSHLLGLGLAFVHACLCSFCARWFVWPSFRFVRARSCYFGLWWGSLRALQPLVYVYIKLYKVSKYMIDKKLTFMAWIMNLDKID
jgi:hypothetical protein